jgi:hypothetical protein
LDNDFESTRSDVTFVGNTDTLGIINSGQLFSSTFYLNVDKTVYKGTYQGTIVITWKQGSLPGDFRKSLFMPIAVSEIPMGDKIPYLQIFLGGLSTAFVGLYVLSRRNNHVIPQQESKTLV